MDTKLKNINYATFFKFIAFLLIAASLTIVALTLYHVLLSDYSYESILVEDYTESAQFLRRDAPEAYRELTAKVLGHNDSTIGDSYYYYIDDGENILTNLVSEGDSFFKNYNGHVYILTQGNWYHRDDPEGSSVNYGMDSKYSGYLAFTTEYINSAQKAWQQQKLALLPLLLTIFGLTALSLCLLIYLTITTGKTGKEAPVRLNGFDKIPGDLLFIFYIMTMVFLIMGLGLSFRFNGTFVAERRASLIILGLMTFTTLNVTGVYYLSVVRRIKTKTLIKNTLMFKILYAIADFFKSIFDGRKFSANKLTKQLFNRQAAFISLSFIMVLLTFVFVFIPPLFILPPLMELLIIAWYVMGNRKTFEAIDRGFNESLEEQMKAERMKIQLVTNVSHDLKTPLTSIISYADLLSKEPCLSEASKDYVNILMDKSNRLKNIVSDLFDLAKSTSGDIQLEIETLDLKKLIEQTLADMGDEIDKSQLKFKTKLPEFPVLINADGRKMYRVFQNLIDNALKYGLEGTRVFLDLEVDNNEAIVSVKNTAGYEMDFTAEEILQRFARGDDARTTEGNGLGLSIAESFTQVCGGGFNIHIDGDLFKVVLKFKVTTEIIDKPLKMA